MNESKINYVSGRCWFASPSVQWWLIQIYHLKDQSGYRYEQVFLGNNLLISGVMDDFGNFVEADSSHVTSTTTLDI